LQAFARTQNPLRMVFELDDEFDSYSAPKDFASVQYEMHLSERGQKVQSVPAHDDFWKVAGAGGNNRCGGAAGNARSAGMMQYLRSVDWAKTPVVHGPVL